MILLDTNVVSELMKTPPDSAVGRWFSLNEGVTTVSAIGLAEIAFGVARTPEGARRRGLEARFAEVRRQYANRVLPFTESTALVYGALLARAFENGQPMDTSDAQIAATALEHSAVLATRNTRHFAMTGLRLVNPWLV